MEKKYIELISELEELQKKTIGDILTNSKLLISFSPPNKEFNEDVANFMLLNNDDKNLVLQTHKLIIRNIIYEYFFKDKQITKEELSKYFYCFIKSEIDNLPFEVSIKKIIEGLKNDQIIDLLERFHIYHLNSRIFYRDGSLVSESSNINFKDKGSVYTPDEIAKEISIKTIQNRLKDGLEKESIKILDFGCGTGRFYLNALNFLSSELKMSKQQIISQHLFGVDIDKLATDILKIRLFSDFDKPQLKDLEIISKSVSNENLLMPEEEINLDSVRNKKFNIIISNPPYFLLKINSKESIDKNLRIFYEKLKSRIDNEIKYFRKSKNYKYSSEGMLNYYKLSIESILNLAEKDAELGIICPSTLFADLSSTKLRKHLLLNNKLREINYFPEAAKLFENITQSTIIFYLKKDGKTDEINIKIDDAQFIISLSTIEKVFDQNYEIPLIDEMGWKIIDKLSTFKKLKEFSFIRNKRGELDLTSYKSCITKEDTLWRLVRGNMITLQGVLDKNEEYVLIDKFLKSKSESYKNNDFNKERLICQQISNIDSKKRLNFVICNKNDIIANSCNYISSTHNINLNKLKILLNSYLLNWRFKITSSNNHINNYELEELPLIDVNKLPPFEENELLTNINIFKLYGLNLEETKYILNSFYNTEEIESKWGINKNEDI